MGATGYLGKGALGASAVLLGLVACGGPDPFPVTGGFNSGGSVQAGNGPVESTAPPISSEDFFAQEAHALCSRLFRCLSPRDDDMSLRFLFGTTAVCEAEVARYNERSPNVADLRQKFAAGDLVVTADAAQSCLEELAACGEADSLGEGSCREVFEGNVEQGGACQRDEDCAGNSYCAGDGCPGQCQPRRLPGAACTSPTQCAYWGSPVFCDTASSTGQGTCRELDRSAKAGPGEKCTRSFKTAQQAFFQCRDDLWCAPPASDDGTGFGHCEPPIEGEGACSDQNDVCLIGLCNVQVGHCQAYDLVREAGGACSDAALVYCDPLQGLRCSDDEAGGICEKQGSGTEGSVCFTGDFQRGCAMGFYCQRDDTTGSGSCVKTLARGEPCESSGQCQSGSCAATCLERYCSL